MIKRPLSEERLRRNRIDFYKFFKEHDRRRNTNFLETFPELREFWGALRRAGRRIIGSENQRALLEHWKNGRKNARDLKETMPKEKKQQPLNQIEIEKKDLSFVKERLDSVSPSMCLAKWLFAKIHLSTGKTQSCYHVPEHFTDKEEILVRPSALHNTGQKKLERVQMLKGERPEGCSYCWRD